MAVSVKPAVMFRDRVESRLSGESRGTHAGPRAMVGTLR